LGEQTQTQYCLGLVDFALGNSGPAKNHFLQASQWNYLAQDQDQSASEQDDLLMPTFLVKEYASYNAAVLAAEYVPDSADKQFMIAHASKWEDPEAAAQAGLYFFKLGDDSVAEEYLSKAAQAYFPYDELQVPSLQGATNGTIACKDQEYSDAQILAKFFAHKEPPLERISSRYAQYSTLHQVTDLHSLTFDFSAGYEYLVRDLYRKILLKRHKLTELALFDFAASKTFRDRNSDKVKPENDVSDYLHTVQDRLVSSWYCPIHNQADQMSLHLRLDEHGNINRVTIAQPAKVSEINQSVLEAVRWAAPLPAPPPQWHNRDLIVVFNAEDGTAVEHDLMYTTPQPGFAPRPEYY
jgi:TonB family protein